MTSLLAAISLDPKELIGTFGTLGLFLIIFAESGLLIGFFLPGDSLLFTAGLLAAEGTLNLPTVLVTCFVAAVLGDQVGYIFGRRVGPSIFRRPDSRLFKVENIERAREFFDRHGPKTIVLARFVPVVRTFAPIVAGVSGMDRKLFTRFNILGALLWAVGVTMAGYLLGSVIPDIDKYLLPIVFVIVVLSAIPVFIEARKARKRRIDEVAPEPVPDPTEPSEG